MSKPRRARIPASAGWIIRFDKGETRSCGAGLDSAIEARATAGVAGAAVAADLDEGEKGVLIAVDPQLDEPLGLAGGVALPPQRAARAGPVVDDAGLERRLERLGVHVRDHQHVAALRVDRDAGR